jgi:glyoxylase-like metal-dependent hydrolase (beta-lactamase superfamily II)
MVERIIVGPLYTNTYAISTGKKECILVDPGADSEEILSRLEVLNVVPVAIVFTHGHLEHTSAAQEIIDHYSEREMKIDVGIHRSDRPYLPPKGKETNAALFRPFGKEATKVFKALYRELPKPTFFLKDGDPVLDTDFVVLHTPGHSQGSVCLYSEDREMLFSGDTLFFKTVGRTDVVGADLKKMTKSIRSRLFELPPETRLFPGHGPNSTLEREIEFNDFEPNPQI